MKGNLSKPKTVFFETTLSDFLANAGRDLPWRKRGIGAYEIWASEIMLQQTQVSRVISYYEKFLKRFPTVESLAKTTWEEFLPYYAGLGYYARGRNMLKAAKMIVSEYGGKFPADVKELEGLPGVGPYTAAAIVSFAYGKDTVAWDTNLCRVVGRFFFGTKHLSLREANLRATRQSRKEIWIATPRRSVGTRDDGSGKSFEIHFSLTAKILNAAMMDFGSAICTARPKCGNCPLASRCVYFKEDGKQEYTRKKMHPSRSKTREFPSKRGAGKGVSWKDARAFVILHENHKKYYSPYKTKLSPFVIPQSHNTRAGIKDWFRGRYALELSVRPPHKKELVDGKPTLFVNAQILSGRPKFAVFGKDSAVAD